MTGALRWRKSTYSGGGDGDTCVEIAPLPARIAVRDSKAPARAVLTFPTPAFAAFLAYLEGPRPTRGAGVRGAFGAEGPAWPV
ncbi:DUF397 domain-containing protein [Streptomyces murinus]|uniref:DUF397 domain-containing protein n=1 Tax=Streptomyces murinus TaxID=33900 RepID=UPI002E1450F4|nr:DUF397 domain-containing protein [Streptomyces murinus]